MNTTDFHGCLEAQLLMGHRVPSPHWNGSAITAYSWEESQVRLSLCVPLDARWEERLLALEVAGLATFSLFVAPLEDDGTGTVREVPGWRDQPRDQWGSLSVDAKGVLRLAELYGRPYVRAHESPAVLAHWQLVQRDAQARLDAPTDEATWQREWPERYTLFKAREHGWDADDWPVAQDEED